MKSILEFRNVFLSLLLLIAFQTNSPAQTSASFDQQKMTTYLNALQEKNKFMGSVAFDSAGNEVYNRSFGFIDAQENSTLANGETKYRIGSVSKTFTAVMIMQLIEEGELSLSTKLADYYPELPQAEDITVEHLLRHQSGLFNFTNAPDYPKWMTEERSKEQLLEIFRNDTSQFDPGSQTNYSNTNYVLLTYIIEDITGESYAAQLQKRIAEPLDLQHTYYGNGIDTGQNEAASFQFAQSQWNILPETDLSIPGGAGGIVSTPDDMTDFIRALFEGKLVSQESLDKMTTIEDRLGLGLMKIPFHDSFAYGHNGGIDGFQSNLSYFPDEEVAFAFTSNGLNYAMNDILVGLLSIYFGHEFEIPSFEEKPSISLSEDQIKQYTGTYISQQIPPEIEVFVENGMLKAQATGQGAFPLTATNETTMRFDQAGVVMKFDSLNNGKYQQFTLKQGGGQFLFERKGEN